MDDIGFGKDIFYLILGGDELNLKKLSRNMFS
jgi:hypothetical protein